MVLLFQVVLVSTMSKQSDLSRSFGYAGQVNAYFYKTRQKEANTTVSRRSAVATVLPADNTTPAVQSHQCLQVHSLSNHIAHSAFSVTTQSVICTVAYAQFSIFISFEVKTLL